MSSWSAPSATAPLLVHDAAELIKTAQEAVALSVVSCVTLIFILAVWWTPYAGLAVGVTYFTCVTYVERSNRDLPGMVEPLLTGQEDEEDEEDCI